MSEHVVQNAGVHWCAHSAGLMLIGAQDRAAIYERHVIDFATIDAGGVVA